METGKEKNLGVMFMFNDGDIVVSMCLVWKVGCCTRIVGMFGVEMRILNRMVGTFGVEMGLSRYLEWKLGRRSIEIGGGGLHSMTEA